MVDVVAKSDRSVGHTTPARRILVATTRADPEHDIFSVLERWVEHDEAPARLMGSGPSPLDPALALRRPLCPYPTEARYAGSGDPNNAASFVCAPPVAPHGA